MRQAPPRSHASRPEVLLFTDWFPFGTAEQFVAAEIPYLAERFQVVVVPAHARGPAREVPASVSVDVSLAEQRCARGWHERARLWTSPRLAAECIRRPDALCMSGGLRTMYRYLRQAHRVLTWLQSRLAARSPTSTILYTYWFGREALGIGLAKARFPEYLHVSRAHLWEIYEEANVPPLLPFQHTQARTVDLLCAISEHGRAHLATRFPRASGHMTVCRLGVDEPGFAAKPSEDGVVRIVSCSRIAPEKRVGRIVEVLTLLARASSGRAIRWDHFGDGGEASRVRALAGANLPSNVAWHLHGNVPQPRIIEHYRSHPVDLFLNVSTREGVPVTIMEAQSCAIPIAATAVGGTPEIVGDVGLLLQPGDSAAAMARALGDLLDDRPRLLAQRGASRDMWQQRYRADANFREFAERLWTLLATRLERPMAQPEWDTRARGHDFARRNGPT